MNVVHLSQVFCIVLFLCAASLFGTIIAQINEIVADITTKKKGLDKVLEAYLTLNPRLANENNPSEPMLKLTFVIGCRG